MLQSHIIPVTPNFRPCTSLTPFISLLAGCGLVQIGFIEWCWTTEVAEGMWLTLCKPCLRDPTARGEGPPSSYPGPLPWACVSQCGCAAATEDGYGCINVSKVQLWNLAKRAEYSLFLTFCKGAVIEPFFLGMGDTSRKPSVVSLNLWQERVQKEHCCKDSKWEWKGQSEVLLLSLFQ